jgi:iron complex transport system substrate-binding protein
MFRWVSRRILLAVIVFAASGAARAADTSRIVSIGGAVTEILYALGADKNVVAVDTTSLYPAQAMREKASVGYMRALSAEGVLGLRPSLILATEGSGPKETMTVLQAAKVPLVTVPDHHTGEGIIEKIQIIAKAVDAETRGNCIADAVKKDLGMLQALRSDIKTPKRVMFVLSLVSGRAMVSGRNTAADGIIKMAGAVNAVTDYDGYKQISDEAVIAAKPDIILAMERGGPNPVTAGDLFSIAAFSGTPAAQGKHFVAMNGLYLLGFGPRSARAARDLSVAVYPELAPKAPAPAPMRDDACRE